MLKTKRNSLALFRQDLLNKFKAYFDSALDSLQQPSSPKSDLAKVNSLNEKLFGKSRKCKLCSRENANTNIFCVSCGGELPESGGVIHLLLFGLEDIHLKNDTSLIDEIIDRVLK